MHKTQRSSFIILLEVIIWLCWVLGVCLLYMSVRRTLGWSLATAQIIFQSLFMFILLVPQALLKYHTLNSVQCSEAIMAGSIYETLEGSNIEIGCDGESLTVNGIKMVLKKDIVTNNGVIHLIDQVLMPDSGELQPLSQTCTVQPSDSKTMHKSMKLPNLKYINPASDLWFLLQPSRWWSLLAHLKVSSRTWCPSLAFPPPCNQKPNILFSPRSTEPSLVSLHNSQSNKHVDFYCWDHWTFSRQSVFVFGPWVNLMI